MKIRSETNTSDFTPFCTKLMDDLQKSGCCGQDSERKQVIASSSGSLAYALIDLAAFWSVGTHFPSENSILPDFSIPRAESQKPRQRVSIAVRKVFAKIWKVIAIM